MTGDVKVLEERIPSKRTYSNTLIILKQDYYKMIAGLSKVMKPQRSRGYCIVEGRGAHL